ncbi:Predicted phospholipase, patatin/cPLA2 family [Butyrivibrio sp. ob235]|uniref:patatin-like phospholipase family protein n=1 Tax=Butyrivibrio sp. ob235 TaxID=1761780 RepID=UPI0008C62672|nr:patatin family protein [Butyrivibrio sp. ob235]SEM65198.1 Predicted phospholipase, patatin/cPLA2 family [Butyrivibrio sp. ob235]
MKTGIVMEGGALRGLFTCGVIDVLLENGINFDGGIGVSAGATFGCNIKSKQIGRPLRYNKKYAADKRYKSISSWIKTGDLFGVDFCYNELPFKLDLWDDKTFTENPMEFYVVATDVETGEAAYHKCYDGLSEDIRWIQASASMPLASRIVEIDGRKYLDGGTADSIPLKFMEDEGFDHILVVETQPYEYVKKKQDFMWLIKRVYRHYPKFIEAIENRYIMYNEEKKYVREREKEGKVLVIRPKEPLNIKPLEKDPQELDRVYNAGRDAANKLLSKDTWLKGNAF